MVSRRRPRVAQLTDNLLPRVCGLNRPQKQYSIAGAVVVSRCDDRHFVLKSGLKQC